MNVLERPFPRLLEKMKAKFTSEENAEMVAMITAAESQFYTLLVLVGNKQPEKAVAIASTAITFADGVAEKVIKGLEEQSEREKQN